MFKYFKKIFTALDIHTKEVIKKSISSTLVKVLGIVAALIVSVVLGRVLGADGLGIINLANRIGNLLVVFALFGMSSLLVKEVAIAQSKDDLQHIGDSMFTAYSFNGILALVLAIIVILFSPFLVDNVFHSPELKTPLIIAVAMIIPMVYSRIFSAGLIGFRKIWQSNLVNQTLSIWIVGILLLVFLLIDAEINVVNVAIMYGIGRLVVFFSIGIYWRIIYKPLQKSKIIIKQLIKPSSSLFLVSISAVIMGNAGIIILGWLKDTRDVGLFSVALQIALLTVFFLQVTNASVAPKIAALYADNKKIELEKMMQRVTKGLFFIGLFILLVFLFGGREILSLWGSEFIEAYLILIIIGVGQLINLSTGAVGFVLMMTGFERVLSRISLLHITLNIILNFILISMYGLLGAAIATALTMASENITKVIYVKSKTGINVFSFMKYIS